MYMGKAEREFVPVEMRCKPDVNTNITNQCAATPLSFASCESVITASARALPARLLRKPASYWSLPSSAVRQVCGLL
jgi:hypothetical protein